VRVHFGDNHLENGKTDGMSFVTSLTKSASLKMLALDSNRLLPDSVANLPSLLNILSLGTNQLSGSFPAEIERYVNFVIFKDGG